MKLDHNITDELIEQSKIEDFVEIISSNIVLHVNLSTYSVILLDHLYATKFSEINREDMANVIYKLLRLKSNKKLEPVARGDLGEMWLAYYAGRISFLQTRKVLLTNNTKVHFFSKHISYLIMKATIQKYESINGKLADKIICQIEDRFSNFNPLNSRFLGGIFVKSKLYADDEIVDLICNRNLKTLEDLVSTNIYEIFREDLKLIFPDYWNSFSCRINECIFYMANLGYYRKYPSYKPGREADK